MILPDGGADQVVFLPGAALPSPAFRNELLVGHAKQLRQLAGEIQLAIRIFRPVAFDAVFVQYRLDIGVVIEWPFRAGFAGLRSRKHWSALERQQRAR